MAIVACVRLAFAVESPRSTTVCPQVSFASTSCTILGTMSLRSFEVHLEGLEGSVGGELRPVLPRAALKAAGWAMPPHHRVQLAPAVQLEGVVDVWRLDQAGIGSPR